jgi:hypothetical protein
MSANIFNANYADIVKNFIARERKIVKMEVSDANGNV